MLSSTASISLIRRLISSGEVGETEADIWLTHLAFVANPTKEMLREIKVGAREKQGGLKVGE